MQAEENITGSRDAIRLAFRRRLINDGENWMDMIASRVKSSHTYDEVTAAEIVKKIQETYIGLIKYFNEKMNQL